LFESFAQVNATPAPKAIQRGAHFYFPVLNLEFEI